MKQVGTRATRDSSLQVFPLLASAVTFVMIVTSVALTIVNRGVDVDLPVPEPAGLFVPIQVASAVIWTIASWSLLQRRDLAWSRLAAIAALSHAVTAAGYSWGVHGLIAGHPAPGASLAAGMTFWLMPVEMPVGIFMIVSLPSGRLGRSVLDRLGWLAVGMAAAGVAVEAISDPDVVGTDFSAARNPLSLGFGSGPFTALLIAPAAVLAVCVLVVRWRRSAGADRLALRWVVWLEVVGTAVVVPLIALGSPALAVGVAQVVGGLGLLALVTVIRRQNLLGVEKLFERTLRFVLLAGSLMLVYAGVIAAGSELIGSGARPLAAAAVALSVLPLRDGLARVVARFVYGERANAADIVRGVAGRAEHAGSPNEMLERFLEDLVVGTGCGGATVQLAGNRIIAGVGETDAAGSTLIPLRHRGAVVGELQMWPAPGELCLDGLANRVARDVAPHLALVVDACRADLALEQARERLVRGREEERRRLRRDLHDGLGPILTGVAFSADAASNLVETDPRQAIELIVAARRDVTDALGEIRRIVEDLRPPALDELGLEGAIRQHAQRLPQLEVTVTGSIRLVDLPAAVEVAAYRIATEALTNVARHANATKANVDVTLNGHLAVAISDDGQRQETWVEGVGLGSMRDRARELGGVLAAGPFSGGGRVVANLPVESR